MTDGSGPLGGVDVTVSDGEVTYSTRTPTTGDGIGRWSIPRPRHSGGMADHRRPPRVQHRDRTRESGCRRHRRRGQSIAMVAGASARSVDGGRAWNGRGSTQEGRAHGHHEPTAPSPAPRARSPEGDVGTYLLPQLPVPGVYTITLKSSRVPPLTGGIELTLDEVSTSWRTRSKRSKPEVLRKRRRCRSA